MDSTTLVNVGIIAIFVFVICLIYINIRAHRRHLAGDTRQEEAFKKWLKDNAYAHDQFHFYRGTGIAFSRADERLAVFENDSPAFHRKDAVNGIGTHEDVSGRMVAAAPGVVRQVNTTLYVLDISIEVNQQLTCKVTFADGKQRAEWEKRLKGMDKVKGQAG